MDENDTDKIAYEARDTAPNYQNDADISTAIQQYNNTTVQQYNSTTIQQIHQSIQRIQLRQAEIPEGYTTRRYRRDRTLKTKEHIMPGVCKYLKETNLNPYLTFAFEIPHIPFIHIHLSLSQLLIVHRSHAVVSCNKTNPLQLQKTST